MARQRAFDGSVGLPHLELQPQLAQILDESPVLRIGEPLGDQLGPVRADPVCLLELLLGRGDQCVDGCEVPGEASRQHPTHLRHVEAEQHA